MIVNERKIKFFTFRSVLRFKMWYNNKCQRNQLKKKVEKKKKIAFRSVLKLKMWYSNKCKR